MRATMSTVADNFARLSDIEALRWRLDAMWQAMNAMAQVGDATAARRVHIAGGFTTAGLLAGATQAGIVLQWPGDAFPDDQYDVETVALAAGISAISVTAQTASSVTVSITAALALSAGAGFALLGKSRGPAAIL